VNCTITERTLTRAHTQVLGHPQPARESQDPGGADLDVQGTAEVHFERYLMVTIHGLDERLKLCLHNGYQVVSSFLRFSFPVLLLALLCCRAGALPTVPAFRFNKRSRHIVKWLIDLNNILHDEILTPCQPLVSNNGGQRNGTLYTISMPMTFDVAYPIDLIHADPPFPYLPLHLQPLAI
jgi:hypothetical protein